ncbi:MAG: hypothetical protein MUQ27_07825 [Acidimicrobiia bacterium]|nr:hypothetical protein [Acidimicrobiia bacterium]
MEATTTQHPTGFICSICEGIAVVELDGGYLCARHGIEAMVMVDLRAEEPIVTVSTPDVNR